MRLCYLAITRVSAESYPSFPWDICTLAGQVSSLESLFAVGCYGNRKKGHYGYSGTSCQQSVVSSGVLMNDGKRM
ncbi:MAG: hypothetical protein VX435_08695 [Planctomycetota bacterium]|nr:hypothetical protein [Planctomycetota bacterium]